MHTGYLFVLQDTLVEQVWQTPRQQTKDLRKCRS